MHAEFIITEAVERECKAAWVIQIQHRLSKAKAAAWPKGRLRFLLIEDGVEVETTLDHHIKLGFKQIIVLAKSLPEVDEDTLTQVTTVYVDTFADDRVGRTVNTLMPHMAGAWVYVGFNAEDLFFPFASSRSVAELLAFHTEERRVSMLTYVVDLYAGDLNADPTGVNVDDAYLDRA